MLVAWARMSALTCGLPASCTAVLPYVSLACSVHGVEAAAAQRRFLQLEAGTLDVYQDTLPFGLIS